MFFDNPVLSHLGDFKQPHSHEISPPAIFGYYEKFQSGPDTPGEIGGVVLAGGVGSSPGPGRGAARTGAHSPAGDRRPRTAGPHRHRAGVLTPPAGPSRRRVTGRQDRPPWQPGRPGRTIGVRTAQDRTQTARTRLKRKEGRKQPNARSAKSRNTKHNEDCA